MKRSTVCLLLLSVLLALLLGACGRAESAGTEAQIPAPAETSEPASMPEPTPQPLAIPELSPAESRQMANFMFANRSLVSDQWLYCFSFDEEYRPVLARFHLKGGQPEDFRILAEDCVPEYLCLHDGVLYYINTARGGALERVAVDGGSRETLADGPVDYLQLVDETLRYRRSDGFYCSCELDGSGEETLIFRDCYYPYSCGGLVLYQDDLDDERLHLRRLSDGKELVLTEGAAYAPLFFDGCLYYTGGDGLVYRLDPAEGETPEALELAELTGAAELLPGTHGLQIRGLREVENGLIQWTASETRVLREEERSYRLCDYLGDYRVEALYQPDGRILSFLLVTPDGTEHRYLGAVEPGGETAPEN